MDGNKQIVEFGWIDIKRSLDKKSKQANLNSLWAVGLKIIQDTEPFVPRKTGRLRKSAKIVTLDRDGCSIEYSRRIKVKTEDGGNKIIEGAEDLYEGINPVTGSTIYEWTTPGTGPDWLNVSIEENQQDWYDLFTREWVRSFTQGGSPKNSGITVK